MKVNILYFGPVTDHSGCHSEMLIFENEMSVRELRNALTERYRGLSGLKFNMAVNTEISKDEDRLVRDMDEVAVLPPYAGG